MYSLKVLVVNQKEIKKPLPKSSIKILTEFDEWQGREFHNWKFMGGINGVFYNLCIEDGYLSAYSLIDTDFEPLNSDALPSWIEDELTKENLTRLWAKEKYKKDLYKLLKQLQYLSPNKTLMIHTRYQGGDNEVIEGVLTLNKYLSMLDEGTTLFNVCYIIRN